MRVIAALNKTELENRIQMSVNAMNSKKVSVGRRNFLRVGGGVVGGTLLAAQLPTSVAHATTALPFDLSQQPDRRLRLANAHTWEKLDIVYWTRGVYIDESLDEINHLMRDHRADVATKMDIKLLDNLHAICEKLGTENRVHILSGYRTPETNAKLRQRSKGVAKYSLHMEGRAVDVNIPGIKAQRIQEAALGLQAGGVGYYKSSGFVHIDTGRVRHWERG